MARNSSIEWTETTWNPTTGCTKISAGCLHCYAERMAKRLQAMGQPNYANGFVVTCHEHMLDLPLLWRKPQTIFVNSMSDLFHEAIPEDFIVRVFDVMSRAPWHTFQVLTKRSERMAEMAARLPWPDHVWMGVSVESGKYLSRIDDLRLTGAAIKFCSMEPLLGPMPAMDLSGIDWVIVGGESGPHARPMQADWVRGIQACCQDQSVLFYFKQWGGPLKKKTGCLLDGREWKEKPVRATGEMAHAHA